MQQPAPGAGRRAGLDEPIKALEIHRRPASFEPRETRRRWRPAAAQAAAIVGCDGSGVLSSRSSTRADAGALSPSSIEAMGAFANGDPPRVHDLPHDPQFLLELPECAQTLEVADATPAPGPHDMRRSSCVVEFRPRRSTKWWQKLSPRCWRRRVSSRAVIRSDAGRR